MPRWLAPVVAGALAAFLCLGAVAWADRRQTSQRRRDIERETRMVGLQLADRLKSALEKYRLGLEQTANFYENSERVTEEEFDDFASTTFRLLAGSARISFVDETLRLAQVYPHEAYRHLVGFDLNRHPEGLALLKEAREAGEGILSPPTRLLDGSEGFVLVAPVFSKGRFLGEVVGAFRSVEFFSTRLVPELLERYQVTVRSSGRTLLESVSPPADGSLTPPVSTEAFTLARNTWAVEVRPRSELYLADVRTGQATLWILGGLLALALSIGAAAAARSSVDLFSRMRSQRRTLHDTRQRLDDATERLVQAEKLSALGELVAGVAHEINNPLSSVLGHSEILLARSPSPEDQRRLEVIQGEAERIGKIVQNLLAFARKQPPKKEHADLNTVVGKALELMSYHLNRAQVRLDPDLDLTLPQTMLDVYQVQQVLINLLTNAQHAVSETGRGGCVRVSTRLEGGRVVVRVSDDGPGVPPSLRDRIFEPFFTTQQDGKGTGLGLSMCYGIVQEHGGDIRLDPTDGPGATFVVELPVAQPEPGVALTGEARELPQVPASRILVVDDEDVVRELLAEVLASDGHRVETASDVPEALEKIAAERFDVVVSDMKMPSGSGRELYRAILEKDRRLAGRIVFTTGDGVMGDTVRFVRETGNEVVLKPFRLEELEAAIARAVLDRES